MGMQIFVQNGSTTLTLDVESSDTIEGTKQKIADQTGILYTQQQLTFDGTVLDDANTLTDYNIQKNATLILTLIVESRQNTGPFQVIGRDIFLKSFTKDSGEHISQDELNLLVQVVAQTSTITVISSTHEASGPSTFAGVGTVQSTSTSQSGSIYNGGQTAPVQIGDIIKSPDGAQTLGTIRDVNDYMGSWLINFVQYPGTIDYGNGIGQQGLPYTITRNQASRPVVNMITEGSDITAVDGYTITDFDF